MAKITKVSIDSKIKYLKFMLVELLKKTLESKDANKFDLQFSLSLDKIILYPFFLSTANGAETREKMFTHAFTDFKSNDYGIYENGVKEKIITSLDNSEELFTPFFNTYNLSENENNIDDLSKVFLIPNWDKIEKSEEEDINEKSVIDKDLLTYCVNHILKTHSKFLEYTIDELRNISYYHEMWKFLKFTNKTINFDNKNNDSFEKERFINQESPLYSLK